MATATLPRSDEDRSDSDRPGEDAGRSVKEVLQNGYSKARPPNPRAFVQLPWQLFDDLGGLAHHMGLNWRPLLFSHLAFRAQRQVGEVRAATYETGGACVLGEDEFVYTMTSCVEDFYALMAGKTDRSGMYRPGGRRTEKFDRWYQRFKKQFYRIEDMGLARRGEYCVPEALGTKGTKWRVEALTTDQVQALPRCGRLRMQRVEQYAGGDLDGLVEEFTEDGLVDVARLYQAAFSTENPRLYSRAEACTSVRDRGSYEHAIGWARHVAETTTSQDRHMSIGSFRPADTRGMGITEETPCAVPWLIFEAEKGDLFDRYHATRCMLERLEATGCDMTKVIVSYSGNKSFHVRLPAGLFDRPVFSSVDDARRTIGRFATEFFEETLDVALFDPRHLIRMIGSRHEDGGYVTAFRASTFQSLSLEEALQASREPAPFRLEHPWIIPQCRPLTGALEAAAESLDRFWIPEYEDVPAGSAGPGGAVERAMKGVSEGEPWHDRHIGRNKATFVAACHLLKKTRPEKAWTKLLEVNRRHDPPLPEREVRQCYTSAQRTIKQNQSR